MVTKVVSVECGLKLGGRLQEPVAGSTLPRNRTLTGIRLTDWAHGYTGMESPQGALEFAAGVHDEMSDPHRVLITPTSLPYDWFLVLIAEGGFETCARK